MSSYSDLTAELLHEEAMDTFNVLEGSLAATTFELYAVTKKTYGQILLKLDVSGGDMVFVRGVYEENLRALHALAIEFVINSAKTIAQLNAETLQQIQLHESRRMRSDEASALAKEYDVLLTAIRKNRPLKFRNEVFSIKCHLVDDFQQVTRIIKAYEEYQNRAANVVSMESTLPPNVTEVTNPPIGLVVDKTPGKSWFSKYLLKIGVAIFVMMLAVFNPFFTIDVKLSTWYLLTVLSAIIVSLVVVDYFKKENWIRRKANILFAVGSTWLGLPTLASLAINTSIFQSETLSWILSFLELLAKIPIQPSLFLLPAGVILVGFDILDKYLNRRDKTGA